MYPFSLFHTCNVKLITDIVLVEVATLKRDGRRSRARTRS
jgi:hypothetical protein